MQPVRTYARVIGIATAALSAPLAVLLVAAVTLGMAGTTATIHRTTSFAVGGPARLTLDVRFGSVLVEGGAPGRITVEDLRSASAVTRAGAGAAVVQTQLTLEQQGDEVRVRETSPLLSAPETSRSGSLTIRVPARTELDLTCLGDLEVDGVDGRLRVAGGGGDVTLRNVTLRGESRVDDAVGGVRLLRSTVAGSTVVTSRLGTVTFDGTLAPGGSSLSILGGGGDVTVALPHPTDARAAVATQVGELDADPVWHFAPDQLGTPRRWTANLGPNPTGSVYVATNLGNINFTVR
jgi:hypothetical protein